MGGMQHEMLMPGMLTEDQLKQLDAARSKEFDRLFLVFPGLESALFVPHGGGYFGLQLAVIHRLAISLCERLEARDPLCERVHHSKAEAALLAIGAAVPTLFRRAA